MEYKQRNSIFGIDLWAATDSVNAEEIFSIYHHFTLHSLCIQFTQSVSINIIKITTRIEEN